MVAVALWRGVSPGATLACRLGHYLPMHSCLISPTPHPHHRHSLDDAQDCSSWTWWSYLTLTRWETRSFHSSLWSSHTSAKTMIRTFLIMKSWLETQLSVIDMVLQAHLDVCLHNRPDRNPILIMTTTIIGLLNQLEMLKFRCQGVVLCFFSVWEWHDNVKWRRKYVCLAPARKHANTWSRSPVNRLGAVRMLVHGTRDGSQFNKRCN